MPNLSNASDAQAWVDGNKVTITDSDDQLEQDAAEKMIRGYLAGRIDPAILATWNIATPTSVPDTIREISGKFVAAFRYRKLYAQGKGELSQYGMQLYNEAYAQLMQVVDGTIILTDPSNNPLSMDTDHMTDANFWPNDNTQDAVWVLANPDTTTGGYKFGMGMIF